MIKERPICFTWTDRSLMDIISGGNENITFF